MVKKGCVNAYHLMLVLKAEFCPCNEGVIPLLCNVHMMMT
jgi:hypothetical protein